MVRAALRRGHRRVELHAEVLCSRVGLRDDGDLEITDAGILRRGASADGRNIRLQCSPKFGGKAEGTSSAGFAVHAESTAHHSDQAVTD